MSGGGGILMGDGQTVVVGFLQMRKSDNGVAAKMARRRVRTNDNNNNDNSNTNMTNTKVCV